jgi:hypothetical protein
MEKQASTSGPNQLKFMIIIAKIFNFLNNTKIQPCLHPTGCLAPWVNVICGILDAPQDDANLIQKSDDPDTIEKLDQHEWWILKGICAKISVKLYTK